MSANPANLIVRDACARDIDAITAWLDDPGNPLWRAADLRKAMRASAYRLVVACSAGAAEEPAGFALLRCVASEWSLLYLLVAPGMRRRGVAHTLVQSIQDDLQADPLAQILLEVRAGNAAARALYTGCGFVEQGTRPGYYEPAAGDHAREDALLMGWRTAGPGK